jgi:hypothetical protein
MKVDWPRLWRRHAPLPPSPFAYGDILMFEVLPGFKYPCVYLAPTKSRQYHRVLLLDGRFASVRPAPFAESWELTRAEP